MTFFKDKHAKNYMSHLYHEICDIWARGIPQYYVVLINCSISPSTFEIPKELDAKQDDWVSIGCYGSSEASILPRQTILWSRNK